MAFYLLFPRYDSQTQKRRLSSLFQTAESQHRQTQKPRNLPYSRGGRKTRARGPIFQARALTYRAGGTAVRPCGPSLSSPRSPLPSRLRGEVLPVRQNAARVSAPPSWQRCCAPPRLWSARPSAPPNGGWRCSCVSRCSAPAARLPCATPTKCPHVPAPDEPPETALDSAFGRWLSAPSFRAGRELYSRLPRLRQPDRDGLLRRPRPVLSLPHMLELFAHVLAGLG